MGMTACSERGSDRPYWSGSVDGDARAHGQALPHQLRGVDLVVTREAIESEIDVVSGPELLLRTEIARRVLWDDTLYWLEGRMLVSRPHAAPLPGAWRLAATKVRHASPTQAIERISLLDPAGREVGFREHSDDAGVAISSERPPTLVRMLGFEGHPDLADPQSIRRPTDLRVPVPALAIDWSVGAPAPGFVHGADCAMSPRVEQVKKFMRPVSLAIGDVSIHAGTAFELACPADEAWVVQAVSRSPEVPAGSRLLTRFDRRTGKWRGAHRIEAPGGRLVGSYARAGGGIVLVLQPRGSDSLVAGAVEPTDDMAASAPVARP
jgi:hypothetical protein